MAAASKLWSGPQAKAVNQEVILTHKLFYAFEASARSRRRLRQKKVSVPSSHADVIRFGWRAGALISEPLHNASMEYLVISISTGTVSLAVDRGRERRGPGPRRLSTRSVGWSADDITAWIESKLLYSQ